MRRLLATLAGLAALTAARPADAAAQTVLFIGNSFTFGAYSPVWHYRPASVTDLNNEGVGGVPALFKLFSEEAGLDYAVSLETSPGKALEWHWDTHRRQLDRTWDHVVLQSYSTLDALRPGDPTLLVEFTGKFAALFRARNPAVDVRLTATWSRPDLTYPESKPWSGQTIFAMADVLQAASDKAAEAAHLAAVIPVGEGFSRAIRTGFADPDPYDGIEAGKVDLWAVDHYHASSFGYYLEALMAFGSITGRDPTTLGDKETAARELGFSAAQTAALQGIARDALKGRSAPAS